MAQPDAGVSDSRRGRKLGCFLLLALFFAFLFIVVGFGKRVLEAFRVAEPSVQEGLLHVPEDKLELMTFSSAGMLRANLAPAGTSTAGEPLCAVASPDLLRQIEAAVRPLPRGRDGGRSLWVEVVAQRRFGPSPCQQRHATKGYQALGPLLRIVSIARMRPLGCDQMDFRANRLRCPEPPRPAAPVVLTDTEGQLYPKAALQARAEGRAEVRLLADSQDVVLSCDIVRSSGDASLDAATCDLFRKRPRLIAKQGRTEGYATGVREVTQGITWRLPDDASAR